MFLLLGGAEFLCLHIEEDSLPETSVLGIAGASTAATGAVLPRRIFVSNFSTTGNLSAVNGIAAADGFCAVDSNKPATGTYKAMIVDDSNRRACTTANCSGGVSEEIDWVLLPNTTYVRAMDSAVIFTTNSDAIFNFASTLTNSFDTALIYYWTGFGNFQPDWRTGNTICLPASGQTCCRWGVGGTPTGADFGGNGVGNATNGNSVAYGVLSCGVAKKFLCVEQ